MKRSGLVADRRAGLGFRFFFFNYNGLCGFHEVSIHLKADRSGDSGEGGANHVLSR